MKIGKLLRIIGKGAVIAAAFTPAGAAITQGLQQAGKVLAGPQGGMPMLTPDLNGDEEISPREAAVQIVIQNFGAIYASRPVSLQDLTTLTDILEEWLTKEEGPAK